MTTRSRIALSTSIITACLAALFSAPAARAQPGTPLYASGLLHTPSGSATLEVLAGSGGRKIRATNIGSSGQDGVEIQFHTVSGGTVTIDPGALVPGATLNTKHKKWDGQFRSTSSCARAPDGSLDLEFDYTGAGAIGVQIIGYGSDGVEGFDVFIPGPVGLYNLPTNGVVGIGSCPGGGDPVWTKTYVYNYDFMNTGWVEIWQWICPGSMNTARSNSVVIIPHLPPGTIDSSGLESITVSSSGLSSFDVSDAALIHRGLNHWGNADARITEACDSPIGTCNPSQTSIRCDNIGSSGQDGVSVDLVRGHAQSNPNPGGVTVSAAKASCCNGHRTILKLHDSSGSSHSVTHTIIDDAADTIEELDADFSDLGAIGFRLFLFDEDGDVLGPPEGTAHIAGGPYPVVTNRCPFPQREIWENIGSPSNPTWHFVGCSGVIFPYDFVLPTGEVVTNVHSYSVSPLDATTSFGPIDRLEITQTAGVIDIFDISSSPPFCPGDANNDRHITFADVTSVLSNFGGFSRSGDANGDGTVSFADVTSVLTSFGTSCD